MSVSSISNLGSLGLRTTEFDTAPDFLKRIFAGLHAASRNEHTLCRDLLSEHPKSTLLANYCASGKHAHLYTEFLHLHESAARKVKLPSQQELLWIKAHDSILFELFMSALRPAKPATCVNIYQHYRREKLLGRTIVV